MAPASLWGQRGETDPPPLLWAFLLVIQMKTVGALNIIVLMEKKYWTAL